MKKTFKQTFAAVGLTLCLMDIAQAATSITYTVGGWQITATDLGLLRGGSASSALAINNQGRIIGLATDSAFNLQRPFWDANTGAIIGLADNFDPASTAVEHFNDSGEMAGTRSINQNILFGVYWNTPARHSGCHRWPARNRCTDTVTPRRMASIRSAR